MAGKTFMVESSVRGAVAVVKPIGWLTDENCVEIEEHFRRSAEAGLHRFVVDLSAAHFLDHAGLVVFAERRRMAEEHGGCLLLAAPNGSAVRALAAGRLGVGLRVCETVVAAVELADQKTESGRWKAVPV